MQQLPSYLGSRSCATALLAMLLTLYTGCLPNDTQKGNNDRRTNRTFTQTTATRYGLQAHLIEGDGNCLFRAVADQLQKPPFNIEFSTGVDYHRAIRHIAVEHVSKKKDLYQDACVGGVEQWIAIMSQDKTWGDQIALSALSNALQVTLVVIRAEAKQGENPTIYKPRNPKGIIYLHYKNGNHYESLSERSPMSTEQQQQWEALQTLIRKHRSNTHTPPNGHKLQEIINENCNEIKNCTTSGADA